MKNKDRYDNSGLAENQFQQVSRGRILKNLHGIVKRREITLVEAQEYYRALEDVTRIYDMDHRFCSEDVCKIHHIWLGDFYRWAGEYRRVNLSYEDFPIAMAAQIPKLMDGFENGSLKTHTPCKKGSLGVVAKSLAIVHAELISIHPFLYGNKRVARLLAVLMALQAGFPLLDFGWVTQINQKEYVEAIHSAMDQDYEPMREFFISALRRSLRQSERP